MLPKFFSTCDPSEEQHPTVDSSSKMAGKEAIVTVQDAMSDYKEKQSAHYANGSIDTTGQSTSPLNRPMLRRQMQSSDGNDDEDLTQLGLRWQMIRQNVLLRYVIYIVPVAILLAIPIVLCATVYKGKKIITKFTVESQTQIYSSNVTSIDPAAVEGATIYNNTASTVYQQTKTPDDNGGIHLLGLFIWIEVVWVLLWVAKLLAQAVPIVFQTVGGAIHTGMRRRSASSTAASFAHCASTSGPNTSTGFFACCNFAASVCRSSVDGTPACWTFRSIRYRAVSGAGLSQSSYGIETYTGPGAGALAV